MKLALAFRTSKRMSKDEIEREAASEIQRRVDAGKPPAEEWSALAGRIDTEIDVSHFGAWETTSPAYQAPLVPKVEAAKPAARKPTARKPATSKPTARKPATSKPTASKPVSGKVSTAASANRKPAARKPAAKPAAAKTATRTSAVASR